MVMKDSTRGLSANLVINCLENRKRKYIVQTEYLRVMQIYQREKEVKIEK